MKARERPAAVREEFFGHAQVSVIRARSHLQMLNVRELWAYRELLTTLALRDIKVRYKQTILGAAWAWLRPTLTMLIFTLVFGRLAKMPSDGIPYPLFVFGGLLPWLFFAQTVSGAANSVVGAGPLITRVYFPRLIVPLASAGVAVVDLAMALLLFYPMMLWFGIELGPSVALVPLLLVLTLIVALGVGIWLAAVTVAYRDFRHVEPFLLQTWMSVTPIVYPSSLIPQQWRWIVYVNPMTGVVEGFRAAWFSLPVEWGFLGVSFGIGVVVLFTALLYFGHVERRFADVI
jgi:lipopolysaccharide transport system permease protein